MKYTFFLIILFQSFLVKAQKEVKHVFFVTLDGYRWQELFEGVDKKLLKKGRFTKDREKLEKLFNIGTPHENALALNPFLLGVMEREGVLFGNRNQNSLVNLTNRHRFSFPGYNELLTGKADDERINSNDKINNPNITFLEGIYKTEELEGKVAVFASWDVFPYIINEERSGIYVNAGYENANHPLLNEVEQKLNIVQHQVDKKWESVRFDSLTHQFMMEYVHTFKPSVVYISYGETDDYAHEGSYDEYILSAYHTNLMIQELWNYIQSTPFYKDKTALVITTDHGRGKTGTAQWTGHGARVKGADQTWIAAIGVGINPNLNTEGQFYSDQIAPAIMALLNIDWPTEKPFLFK